MNVNSSRTLLCVLALFLAGCGTVKVEIGHPSTATATRYEPIPLGAAANEASGFASPPTGDVTLGGVPFQLSERIFKSQAAPSPYDDYPTRAVLETDVPRAHRLHLLINTGNGFARFEGRPIGQVGVTCGGERLAVGDLRLGLELREWHLAHNIVYAAPHARQVWVGPQAGDPRLEGHIDLLSLDLPEACRESTLTAIEIVDTSAESVGSLDPALNLFGVTVECRQ
jgi:hypothetical protein